MDWIYMGQDRYQWGALVHTVMNLRGGVLKFLESSRVAEQLSASQEGLGSPELFNIIWNLVLRLLIFI
jgi:hypothetical protein